MNPQNLTTLSDYLNVLRRRIWIVLLCVVVAGGSAYLYSKHQTPEYKATATVGLSPNAILTQVTGTHTSQAGIAQYVAGQTQLADSTQVAGATLSAGKAALASAGLSGMTATQLLSRTSVTGDVVNDQLVFTATGRNRTQAQTLVDQYASAYIAAGGASDRTFAARQLALVNSQIAPIEKQFKQAQANHDTGGENAATNQLRPYIRQKTAIQNAIQGITGSRSLHQADSAAKVKPILSHNIGIGVALGLVIGLALIGLSEALDNRVRRSDDLSAVLGLTMLSKIPTPPRTYRKGNRLGMMEDADDAHTEAYRKLRVNFDFANLGPRAKLIMLTSAVEQEGKSTTISNLAVAFARAGRKVALVDLDLRRPALHRFFGYEAGFGLTDVALGHVELDRAMHPVQINGASGSLEVLATGPLPPHPADFLEAPAVTELLHKLRDEFDIVLVDSAPVLPVSDSVILSTRMDAVIVVARASTLKRHVLSEFHHALSALPVPKLGFILTASEDEAAGYGGYGVYGTYTPYAQTGPASSATVPNGEAPGEPRSDSSRVSTPRTAEPVARQPESTNER